MKTIYLVRHASYDHSRGIYPGRLPVPLSEKGKVQAEKLADHFATLNVQKIYSSAVLRCKQTSEIISRGSIPIEYDKRLLESFSPYQGYWEMTDDWFEFFGHKDDLGGEGMKDVQKRMVSFFNDLVAHLEEHVIVCSHGDPLHSLYLWLSKKPLIADTTPPSEVLDYPPTASIQEIRWNGENDFEIKQIVVL